MKVWVLVFPCQQCGKEQTYKEIKKRNEPGYCNTCRPKKRGGAKKEGKS